MADYVSDIRCRCERCGETYLRREMAFGEAGEAVRAGRMRVDGPKRRQRRGIMCPTCAISMKVLSESSRRLYDGLLVIWGEQKV